MTETQSLITTVAPALRLLLQKDGKPARVSVDDVSGEGCNICLKSDASDQAAVVAELAAALKDSPDATAVTVSGTATFSITAAPTSEGRAAGKVAVVTGAAQGLLLP